MFPMDATPLELQLSQLELLPAQFRTPAKDAASGSKKALARIPSFITNSTEPHTTHLFLPIVYTVLQSSRLPTTDTLDTAGTAKTLDQVYTAILILKEIRPPLPTHIIVHIWPLLWKWIHFIFLHPSCLPHPAPSEDTVCSELVAVVSSLHVGPLTDVSPFSKALHPAGPVARLLTPLQTVSFFTFFIEFHSRIQPNEWAEGAGGTQWRLASLIVKLLDFLSTHPLDLETVYNAPLRVIDKARNDEKLLLTLLKRGVIAALTQLAHVLLTQDFNFPVESHLEGTLGVLWDVCTSTRLFEQCIIDALQARLLTVLFLVIARRKEDPVYTAKLFRLLAASLVHHRVAVEVAIQWPEAYGVLRAFLANGRREQVSGDGGFFGVWSARLRVRTAYDAGEAGSLQACDNMKCGIILNKSRLRRCSQCSKRSYCSTACQMADWRDDGHRKICKSLQKSEMSGACAQFISYGIYLNLFIISLHTLHRRKTTGNKILLTWTWAMAILGTVQIVLRLVRSALVIRFVGASMPGMTQDSSSPASHPSPPAEYIPLRLAHAGMWLLNSVVTDTLFLYRCFVIWPGGPRRMVVVFPALLIVATFVTAVVLLAIGKTLSPAIILGTAANLCLMTLTAGRIWVIRRDARRLVASTELIDRYTTVMAMIFESGALYFIPAILLIILYPWVIPYAVIEGLATNVINIIPTLIVVRVGLGRDVQTTVQTTVQRRTGNSNSTGARVHAKLPTRSVEDSSSPVHNITLQVLREGPQAL
ncbi:hypothetical protein C8R46DRAFT_1224189 [Mycena filopes]|nr:hypothetical protein C8R46DRAFT_1224189 [Mycena filopes]